MKCAGLFLLLLDSAPGAAPRAKGRHPPRWWTFKPSLLPPGNGIYVVCNEARGSLSLQSPLMCLGRQLSGPQCSVTVGHRSSQPLFFLGLWALESGSHVMSPQSAESNSAAPAGPIQAGGHYAPPPSTGRGRSLSPRLVSDLQQTERSSWLW